MPERLEPAGAEWRRYGHQHLQRYRFALEYAEGSRILDFACGVGYGSYVLSQSRERDVTGIDFDREAIAYGNLNYQRPGLRLIEADVLKWQNDGPLFDTIVSFETIEHLPDPSAFLERVASLLKPGGIFLISAPNTLQHKLRKINPIENKFHLNEPDYSTLCAWLQPHFAIEAEWEQSSISSSEGDSIASLREDLESLSRHWWLRAANRLEKGLRAIGQSRQLALSASHISSLIALTDLFPLLPERRNECEVFIFVCRRTVTTG